MCSRCRVQNLVSRGGNRNTASPNYASVDLALERVIDGRFIHQLRAASSAAMRTRTSSNRTVIHVRNFPLTKSLYRCQAPKWRMPSNETMAAFGNVAVGFLFCVSVWGHARGIAAVGGYLV